MTVEVFVAIRGVTLNAFRDELNSEHPNEEAQAAAQYLRNLVAETVWRELPGNQQGISVTLNDESEIPGLIDGLGGPPVKILGAWYHSGLEVGTEQDEAGTVTGDPTYSQVAGLIMHMMPDTDEFGGRPVEPYQAHSYMGWGVRRYG